MATLCHPFNYSAWTRLPQPEEQLILLERQNVPDCMEKVKLIFDKHNVTKLAGATLLHRHFDAGPEERLIERIEGGRSITTPSVPSEKNIIPHTWQLSLINGKVVALPMEFIETNSSTFTEEDYAALLNGEFLTEYYNALANMGLENVLGLTLHHRDALKGSEHAHLDEKSSIARRESVLTSSVESWEPGTIPTAWDFRKENFITHTCGGRWTCRDCTGDSCNH